MAKESGPKNKAESQGEGTSSYAEGMKGAVVFNAAAASERAKKRREEIAAAKKAEEEAAAAAKLAEEQARQAEHEARRQAQLAAIEEARRKHQEAWEAHQEEYDHSEEIMDAFMSEIDASITEASDNGEETIDLTKKVDVDYGPHGDWTREATVSILTGKELGRGGGAVLAASSIDSIIKKDPSGEEFDKEIRDVGVGLMPQVKKALEDAGYSVTVDSETGTITSVSWGEAAKPEEPPKQESAFSKFLSRFRKKD
ncbi:hypothetical protein J5500_03620 [Candidatus Saccharibacteria bacterium]|nr:hypothetical protein [Candidatus Saccharibacteria bacterium]